MAGALGAGGLRMNEESDGGVAVTVTRLQDDDL